MKYRLRSDGSIKTQGELRSLHKNTSLPKVWKQATLDYLGVDPIFSTPKPDTGEFEKAIQAGVELDSKGNWVEAWAIQPMFSDYTDDEGVVVTQAEQELAYRVSNNQTLLDSKKSEIRQDAEAAYDLPVTLPDGSVWNGGMDSALAIDGAVRLAENAGLTQISLYDSTNAERVVDIATGKSIAAAIGAEYQRLFGIKQTCMAQLDGVDLTTITARAEIEAVVFTA